jgi:hypothetical protein
VDLTEADLAGWGQLTKTMAGTFQAKAEFDGSWSYSATVSTTLPDLGEVDVEVADYESWIPEGNWQDPSRPGNRLRVKVRVKPTGGGTTSTKARFTFKLESSQQLGVCLNWPTQLTGNAEDLQFRKEDNPSLDASLSPLEAKTRGLVAQAEAVIACFDYGAFGKLKVEALDKDGRPLRVTYRGRDTSGLVIPKADQGGHIADAWKASKGVEGLVDTWDEAEVPLQDAKGDGLALYAKYRGVVVIEGGALKYLRLPPREKAHFIVDPSDVFDFQRWFMASGIRAYRLDDRLYRSGPRVVDFNGDNGKYAVRLEVDNDPGGPAGQYAFTNEPGSPRVANQVKVFPGRMGGMLGRVRARIQKAVDAPDSPEGIAEAALIQKACGLNLAEAKVAMQRTDPGELLKRLTRLAAIHEMGHACGISDGHVKVAVKDGKDAKSNPTQWVEYEETEEQVGDVECPMQYLDQLGRRRLVVQGLIGGNGAFCKDGFECFRLLTVK